jgi:AraC-like DNA-binding protein
MKSGILKNNTMLNHQSFFEPAEITLRQSYVSTELLMSRLRDLIEQNYRKERNPAFYSGALAYGLLSLNNICREYTGLTVFMLVQERLAIEAERLLVGTRLSAKQVAYELGFCDPAYFCRFFKKMRGKRPLEWRRMASPSHEPSSG